MPKISRKHVRERHLRVIHPRDALEEDLLFGRFCVQEMLNESLLADRHPQNLQPLLDWVAAPHHCVWLQQAGNSGHDLPPLLRASSVPNLRLAVVKMDACAGSQLFHDDSVQPVDSGWARQCKYHPNKRTRAPQSHPCLNCFKCHVVRVGRLAPLPPLVECSG